MTFCPQQSKKAAHGQSYAMMDAVCTCGICSGCPVDKKTMMGLSEIDNSYTLVEMGIRLLLIFAVFYCSALMFGRTMGTFA